MEAGNDLPSDNNGEKSTENDDYWEKEKQIKVIKLITTRQLRDSYISLIGKLYNANTF